MTLRQGGRAARARGLATLATIATFSTLFACGGGGGSVNPANPTPTPRPSTTAPLEPTPAPPTASPGTPTPTVSVYAKPGDLDPTFGGTGFVTIDLSLGSDALVDLAVQPDGRVVAVGYTSGADTSRFAVVRLEADGTMDASFGSNGVVETPIGAVAVALQTDGKIVVAGNARPPGCSRDCTRSGIGVARHDVNGTLDASFADGGISITAIGASDPKSGLGEARAGDVAIDENGRILVVGTSRVGYESAFTAIALLADGTLDSSFGKRGVTRLRGSGEDRPTLSFGSIALQPSGSILAGGSASLLGQLPFLARLTSSGALDAPFGESGFAELPTISGAVGEIGVQSSGRTVIALSDYPPSNTLLVGLTSGGSSDATFGDEGTIATGLPGGLVELLQPGDRILFAGQTPELNAVVVQLRDADGRSIDAFGEHGAAKVYFEGFSIYASALAVQADGKVLLAAVLDPGDDNCVFCDTTAVLIRLVN